MEMSTWLSWHKIVSGLMYIRSPIAMLDPEPLTTSVLQLIFSENFTEASRGDEIARAVGK